MTFLSEGEVLVEEDEETGDIYGFSVEYNDLTELGLLN